MRFFQDFVLFCIICFGLLAPSSAFSSVDPSITYKKIIDAPLRVNYQATMTKQKLTADGDTVRFVQQIIHQHPNRDRIDIPDHNGRIQELIIRIEDDIYRRKGSGESLFYSHRRQSNTNLLDMNLGFSSLDLLQTNYELEFVGSDLLMDRPVVILAFRPRHPGRLTITAWIDEETGVVLRTEEHNEAGVLVEALFLTEFEKDPHIARNTFNTDEWTGKSVEINQVIACSSVGEVLRKADIGLNAPVYIPSGFILQHRRVIRRHGQPVVHFIYSDGLSRISLFQRVASSDETLKSLKGTPEVHGDIYIWDRGSYSILRRYYDDKLFTVIGDITASESVEVLTSLCTIKPVVTASPSKTGYPLLIWASFGVLAVGLGIFWRYRM